MNADTGTAAQDGRLWGRQAWVGLAGGFGAVKLGRQYNPIFLANDSIDPFGSGMAGDASRWFDAYGVRSNNTISYAMPETQGVSGEIAYGFGEELAGNSAAGRTIGLRTAFTKDPLKVVFAYHKKNDATASDSANSAMVGGIYDFGVAKLHVAYQADKGLKHIDTREALIGVTIPFGPHKVIADFIQKQTRDVKDADAHQVALAYVYAMSKRTNLYASAAYASNDAAAQFNVAKAGASDRLYNVGIRHTF